MRFRQLLFASYVLLLSSVAAVAHDDGKGFHESAPVGIGGVGLPPGAVSDRVEFLKQLTVAEMGGTNLNNDIWGWTDPQTGNEYALVGQHNGTAFVDVTNPSSPVYVGRLPSFNNSQNIPWSSVWRDIKVYNNYAYIVADGQGHGLAIFDLTTLRTTAPGTVFSNNPNTNPSLWRHSSFTNAHNIAINEDTGYAYIVGSSLEAGGLHVLNLANPTSPTVAGTGFSADGYTHDVQVVKYHGPDTTYTNQEIAFAANTDTLTIVNMTNKSSPSQIARQSYPGASYTHQGWLSEDHRYYYMNDETDEGSTQSTTTTYIWDLNDLDAPAYLGAYHAQGIASRDHNLYVHEGLIYAANYSSGLRIFDPTVEDVDPSPSVEQWEPVLKEIAFLDTYSTNNGRNYDGAWSVYPFFESGTFAINDRQNGLFLGRLLKGDADGDGDIDNTDILTGVGNFTGPNQPFAQMHFEHGSYDGDGDVDNTDLLTAIGNFTGPGGVSSVSQSSGSLLAAGFADPNRADLLYDPLTGNVKIDPSEAAGGELTGYSLIDGDGLLIPANHTPVLNGSLTQTTTEISEADPFNSNPPTTIVDLGNILPSGMDQAALEAFFASPDSAKYTGMEGTGFLDLDLVVVPEPRATAMLLAGCILLLLVLRRRFFPAARGTRSA